MYSRQLKKQMETKRTKNKRMASSGSILICKYTVIMTQRERELIVSHDVHQRSKYELKDCHRWPPNKTREYINKEIGFMGVASGLMSCQDSWRLRERDQFWINFYLQNEEARLPLIIRMTQSKG